MAIVLISPKKRQRMFFGIITSFIVLIFVAVFLIFFIPEFKNKTNSIPTGGFFSSSNIKINFNIIDSVQVKSLEPFGSIETEFAYVAQDKDGKQIIGKISAASKENAQKVLEEMGFKISGLQETDIGRNEPFIPYYQSSIKK